MFFVIIVLIIINIGHTEEKLGGFYVRHNAQIKTSSPFAEKIN